RSLCHIHAVFFFSSRRRHTRWPRDWSSDVCSSDLSGGTVAGRAGMGVRYQRSSGNDRRRSREPRGVTWLIKEFFNMTVSQTLKTCTLLVLVVGCAPRAPGTSELSGEGWNDVTAKLDPATTSVSAGGAPMK